MDFFETVRTRQSVRRFTDRPVPHEDILAMLEAATQAPSATNDQPWRFIVIRDRGLKDSMRDTVAALLEASISTTDDGPRRDRLASMREYSIHFAEAPVAVAVLARPWAGGKAAVHPDRTSHDLALQSVAMAVAQLLLAATALGLGGCWLGAFDEQAAARALSLPGHLRPVAMVPIGHPATAPAELRKRRPLSEVTSLVE